MQKIQVLFPDPLIAGMRRLAETQDMAVSEVIRRASEEFLAKRNFLADEKKQAAKAVPTFHGGKILVSSQSLREAAYDHDEKR